jgi:hypothetical protein
MMWWFRHLTRQQYQAHLWVVAGVVVVCWWFGICGAWFNALASGSCMSAFAIMLLVVLIVVVLGG